MVQPSLYITGIVHLIDKIVLQNVLLIPDFTHNLLFISKLLSQNILFAMNTPPHIHARTRQLMKSRLLAIIGVAHTSSVLFPLLLHLMCFLLA